MFRARRGTGDNGEGTRERRTDWLTVGSYSREVEDCWVRKADGRHPGVVLAWRLTDDGWRGLVVHTALIAGEWVLLEEWLPDSALELTPTDW
jgi:hypothetical protein